MKEYLPAIEVVANAVVAIAKIAVDAYDEINKKK